MREKVGEECVLYCVSQTAEMTAAGREGPTLNTNGPTMAAQYTIHHLHSLTVSHTHSHLHIVSKVKKSVCDTLTSLKKGAHESSETHKTRRKSWQERTQINYNWSSRQAAKHTNGSFAKICISDSYFLQSCFLCPLWKINQTAVRLFQ